MAALNQVETIITCQAFTARQVFYIGQILSRQVPFPHIACAAPLENRGYRIAIFSHLGVSRWHGSDWP